MLWKIWRVLCYDKNGGFNIGNKFWIYSNANWQVLSVEQKEWLNILEIMDYIYISIKTMFNSFAASLQIIRCVIMSGEVGRKKKGGRGKSKKDDVQLDSDGGLCVVSGILRI